MQKINKNLLTILVVVLSAMLVFAFSGCTQKIASKMVEKAIENAAAKGGKDVDVNLEEGQVQMTDEEGNEISLGGTEKPEDWPDVVPVNKDIKIQFSGKTTTDGKKNWSISGVYSGSGQEIYEYYKGSFTGWNEENDSSMSGEGGQKTYYYQVSNDKYFVSIVIGEKTDEGVAVLLTVSEK